MGKLSGQVAIVTGGGTGIGRAAALGLAAEGARVVLAGRRAAPLEEAARAIAAAGGQALARPVDVGQPEQARELIAWTLERCGRLDILVNNAGINSTGRTVQRTPPHEFDAVMAANVTGPFVLAQAAIPAMLARGGGTIITVSSFAALNPNPMAGAVYSASKAAVHNLMRAISAELRNQGIRACTIVPGEAETPILAQRALTPDAQARATMMQPEDVAAAIVFCATLPARAMVEELVIRPTFLRDTRADIEAALAR